MNYDFQITDVKLVQLMKDAEIKVLAVCSGNVENFDFEKHQAFIYDQTIAIHASFKNVHFEHYFVVGKGLWGYLKNLVTLNKKIKNQHFDIVHAHGGHVGLLCCLQRKIPVVVTFHGSDINIFKNRIISRIVFLLCDISIFVSNNLYKKVRLRRKNSHVIPCGVDFSVFYPMEQLNAKKELGFPQNEKYILFSSSFSNKIKNYQLAAESVAFFKDLKLMPVASRTRHEVNLLLNGAELLLMTSFSEGSPQIIKEAMACNVPIVSVDVGDVRDVLNNTDGTFLCSYDVADVISKIRRALEFGKRTDGRDKIKHLDNAEIAKRIYVNYYSLSQKTGGSCLRFLGKRP